MWIQYRTPTVGMNFCVSSCPSIYLSIHLSIHPSEPLENLAVRLEYLMSRPVDFTQPHQYQTLRARFEAPKSKTDRQEIDIWTLQISGPLPYLQPL